jgi:hypothetical protein
MEYNQDYSELCAFDNIRYTPAWYYKNYPGFYNVECYRILANWEHGIRVDEEKEQDQMDTLDEGVEESKEVDENKKRKRMSVDLENGVCNQL